MNNIIIFPKNKKIHEEPTKVIMTTDDLEVILAKVKKQKEQIKKQYDIIIKQKEEILKQREEIWQI
tara:strand:+ start:473 stop:670 length:198 start_codon:yes stop_codon:yes gene_type:complete